MEIDKLKEFINLQLNEVKLQGLVRHIKQKHKDEYEYIVETTNVLFINPTHETMNFIERLYIVLNDIMEIPKCKGLIPSCTTNLKFRNLEIGYQPYCEKCYTKSHEFSQMSVISQKNMTLEQRLLRSQKIKDSKLLKTDEEKKEIERKKKKTLFIKYGNDGLKHESVKKNKLKTNLERYGTNHPKQSNIVKNTCKQNLIEKYGVDNWMKTDEARKQFSDSRKNEIKKYVLKLIESRGVELISEYENAQSVLTLLCKKCNNTFNILWNSFQQGGGVCPTCFPLTSGRSFQEIEVGKYIESFGFEIITNSKKIIPPFEIDIYIDKLKLCVEYCGLWCHSSGGNIPEMFIKNSDYHINKLLLCESKGLHLITIFEDEWLSKQNIVKNRIQHILGKSQSKILRASDCIVEQVPSNEKNVFLNKFHIQGTDSSSVCLGLYNNELKLVCIMTFTNGSVSKGVKLQNENIWELNRFCSDSEYFIHGCSQKLLSYFKQNFKWEKIFSYADRRWTNSKNNLYLNLGFEEDIIYKKDGTAVQRKPNYWYWGKGIVGRKHRFNFTKSSLKKSIYYDENFTERQIMSLEGRCWIYDCGHLKYVMKK